MNANWQTALTAGTATGTARIELLNLKNAAAKNSSIQVKLFSETGDEYGTGTLENVSEPTERTFEGTLKDGLTTSKVVITVAKNFLKKFTATKKDEMANANSTGPTPKENEMILLVEEIERKGTVAGTTNLRESDLENVIKTTRPVIATLKDGASMGKSYQVEVSDVQWVGTHYTGQVGETVKIKLDFSNGSHADFIASASVGQH